MVFNLFNSARNGAEEEKASATGPVIAYHSSGRIAWSPRDPVTLTKVGFTGNPVGFRAVKLIAEAAAALPLVLQDAERRYETHPIASLMRRPNAGQGRADLFEALYGQVLLSGNGYVEAVGEGFPLELHVLRSDRMSLVPGADGWPIAYDYTVGGRKHRFPMAEGVDSLNVTVAAGVALHCWRRVCVVSKGTSFEAMWSNFAAKFDVVELRSEDNTLIGRGMISCDAEAAALWSAGQAPSAARNHHALVHRDHLVLEPTS